MLLDGELVLYPKICPLIFKGISHKDSQGSSFHKYNWIFQYQVEKEIVKKGVKQIKIIFLTKLEKNTSFQFSSFDWPFGLFRCRLWMHPSTENCPLARWLGFTRQELPVCHLRFHLWSHKVHNAMSTYVSVSFGCVHAYVDWTNVPPYLL